MHYVGHMSDKDTSSLYVGYTADGEDMCPRIRVVPRGHMWPNKSSLGHPVRGGSLGRSF